MERLQPLLRACNGAMCDMNDLMQIHPNDNVAVALRPVSAGTHLWHTAAVEPIAQGHKMALTAICQGEAIVKYGIVVGHATRSIRPGEWVHTHNMATNLTEEVQYSYQPRLRMLPSRPAGTFSGYRRKDGGVGIRNEIWIIPTVGCVNDVAQLLARKNQHLVGNSIEGVYAFTHPYGCSQTGRDHERTKKLLAALARHPNAGAVLVVSLGCENLTHAQFLEELGDYDSRRIRFLICQQTEDEVETGSQMLKECADYAAQFSREKIPASELVIGMKCGGSDGLSGITANPVVGQFSDMMVAQGGTTVLTEVPEMFGAEHFLMDRCISQTVFDRACGMLNGFKSYFIRHGETVYENPSPGNKQGGITTLEEKSCGCIQKGGSAPIADVLEYGERVHTRGLNLLCGPGNDLVSATALTAAGAHLILFTTGRGTPFGAPAPTLKIATNTALADRKKNWIDFNAGTLADGKYTRQEAAEALMRLVLTAASGQQTKAEENGFREIAIFKDGVTL